MLNRLAFKLTCLDVAYPEAPRRHVHGEIQGRCPFSTCRHYGSEDRAPFFVKKNGASWWCSRCKTGGDAVSALAVKAGILPCTEAGRPLTEKEEMQLKQAMDGLKDD